MSIEVMLKRPIISRAKNTRWEVVGVGNTYVGSLVLPTGSGSIGTCLTIDVAGEVSADTAYSSVNIDEFII